MNDLKQLLIEWSHDASGAQEAGRKGNVVAIVDIIDMSTTLEAALEAGAVKVYGACPDGSQVPVKVQPFEIGLTAGREALAIGAPVVIVAEPRWGDNEKRVSSCKALIRGLKKAGLDKYIIVPNLGISTVKLTDFKNSITIAATNSGGAAFDAAYQAGGIVLTATIARTWFKKGLEPAQTGVDRVLHKAYELSKNITFIAASSNSWEDVLAAQFLTQLALGENKKYFH